MRTIIDSLLSEWNEDENGKTKLENTLHGFAGSAIDRLAADSILRGRIDSGARTSLPNSPTMKEHFWRAQPSAS